MSISKTLNEVYTLSLVERFPASTTIRHHTGVEQSRGKETTGKGLVGPQLLRRALLLARMVPVVRLGHMASTRHEDVPGPSDRLDHGRPMRIRLVFCRRRPTRMSILWSMGDHSL